MFICSVKASTIKFAAVIVLLLAVVISVVAIGSGGDVYASVDGNEINLSGIKTREQRIAFIEAFGIKVDAESETENQYKLPESFDRVISAYNQIQIRQGLNLTKYAKKRVTHYSYVAKDYPHEGKVFVNLLVYRGTVIACDVSSSEGEAFVLPLMVKESRDGIFGETEKS